MNNAITKEERWLIKNALRNLAGQSQEDFICSILERRISVDAMTKFIQDFVDHHPVGGIYRFQVFRNKNHL